MHAKDESAGKKKEFAGKTRVRWQNKSLLAKQENAGKR